MRSDSGVFLGATHSSLSYGLLPVYSYALIDSSRTEVLEQCSPSSADDVKIDNSAIHTGTLNA